MDVSVREDEYVCYTASDTFCIIIEHLQKAFGSCEDASIEWCAIEPIASADRDLMSRIDNFIEALEMLDDVQKVSTNLA